MVPMDVKMGWILAEHMQILKRPILKNNQTYAKIKTMDPIQPADLCNFPILVQPRLTLNSQRSNLSTI